MNISPRRLSHAENLHYWVTGALTLAAVPLLRKFGLPLRVEWFDMGRLYWFVVGSQSIFAAGILCVIGFSSKQTLYPLLLRIRAEKLRLILILTYALILWWAFNWFKSLIFTVDTVVLLEFYERFRARGLRRAASVVALPALYLFFGFVLIAAYNLVIVSSRFFAAYDTFFYQVDLWLMRGISVSAIVRWENRVFPLSFFNFLEFIYFGMFAQIGAGLILTPLCFGQRRGMQFVGTILTAYYITFALFFLWPSHGPYYLDSGHFTHFPPTLTAYGVQRGTIAAAQALSKHIPPDRISFQYFIAFPCMHITQPLIVMWYLRKWKRILVTLAVYDVCLVFAIVGLEWHYVADILGGILVAVLAVLATDVQQVWLSRNAQAQQNASAREVSA